MYDWGEEGLFDNSKNMEICTLFAKRFYTKKRFDPAAFHSPISIFEIAIMTDNEDVLETLFNVPDITIKQSRSTQKRPVNIKQALATNAALNTNTLQRLVRLNNQDIDYFLAQNPLIDDQIAQTLLNRASDEVKQAMACNVHISDNIFQILLGEDAVIEQLLCFQKINKTRFDMIETLHPNIGANEALSQEVIAALIDENDDKIIQNLCANESLTLSHLQKIYAVANPDFFPYLASNKNLSQEIVEALYAKKDFEIDRYLALNTNTPMEILEELYNRENFEINQSLALNASLPISYLQQLQLDTRLMNLLKENKTFTENILNNLGI